MKKQTDSERMASNWQTACRDLEINPALAALFDNALTEDAAGESREIEIEQRLSAMLSTEGQALLLEYDELRSAASVRQMDAAFVLGVKWASDPASVLLVRRREQGGQP